MDINIYYWDRMSKREREALTRRAEADLSGVLEAVQGIVEAVKEQGDAALIRFTRQFDGADLQKLPLKVSEAEFEQAQREAEPDLKEAIQFSVENVRGFHRRQKKEGMELLEIRPGVYAGERLIPIPSAGLYVPRGRGSFPSVMYMQAVPAVTAGVKRLAVTTPPDREGRIDAATLYAARLCGIKEVYRVGGAQALAALAYGTESIPRVDKITGPGSIYVAAARKVLAGVVDVGLPAGPSEAIVLADETSDPYRVALDLMIEAEHGTDSSVYLVTCSASLAEEVRRLLPELLERVEPGRAGYIREVLGGFGGIIITESWEAVVEFANAYAPEHLQVACREPLEKLSGLENAGEILLGQYAPFSLANYSVGVNNVIPTGGRARTYSPLSVRDYLKSTSLVYLSEEGYRTLRGPAATLAEYEGFSAHALALKRRERIQ